MSLEGLLAFVAILVAIYEIADPVQRRSLRAFVSFWALAVATCVSVVLILLPEALALPCDILPSSLNRISCGLSFSLPQWLLFFIQAASFFVPAGAVVHSAWSWNQARISRNNLREVVHVFRASVLEGRFEEVNRIINANKTRLATFASPALERALFERELIRCFLRIGSWVHLELLSEEAFLRSLEDRYGSVDSTIRELLLAERSPLRSAVIASYGGHEFLPYADEEKALIGKTFLRPPWYFVTNAHYSLHMIRYEELNSGRLDTAYNGIGRDYESRQGISGRSRCPVFVSLKAHVLAVKEALRQGDDRDFYVTDLWQTFEPILKRSRYFPSVWKNPIANPEHPTPFAYLLYSITHDLEDLCCEALSNVKPDGLLANQLVTSWVFCVWDLANSTDNVGDDFRQRLIRDCLVFTLQLAYAPHEACVGFKDSSVSRAWAEVFCDKLARVFSGDERRRDPLKQAFERLDIGKKYVWDGREWLAKRLGLS